MKADTKNTVFFTLILFLGLFFPTSINGAIQISFAPIGVVFGIILMVIFLKLKLTGNNILIFLLINFCLIAFTFTSEFSQKSLGVYPNFLFFSIIVLLDLKNIYLKNIIKYFFIAASICLILLGIGVIFQISPIKKFILNYYSIGYVKLVPNMLAYLKPIATFGTHSIAGLFLFLFFYLNYLSYKVFKKNIYLINSISLLLLLIFIRSNTAYFYIVIGLAVILPSFKKMKLKVVAIIGVLFVAFIFFILQFLNVSALIESFNLINTLTSDSNGLIGRYSAKSPIVPTINYILEHPFSPLGLSYSSRLYYTDAGFILYLLRGSIILVIMIYLGFYRFIKANLVNKKMKYFLLFVILIFEIGYPILINFRMLYFIPFLIVYLNFLEKNKIVHES